MGHRGSGVPPAGLYGAMSKKSEEGRWWVPERGKGDPGIPMHGAKGELLARTSLSQLPPGSPVPCSRLQVQRTDTLTIQFVTLPPSGERGR